MRVVTERSHLEFNSSFLSPAITVSDEELSILMARLGPGGTRMMHVLVRSGLLVCLETATQDTTYDALIAVALAVETPVASELSVWKEFFEARQLIRTVEYAPLTRERVWVSIAGDVEYAKLI